MKTWVRGKTLQKYSYCSACGTLAMWNLHMNQPICFDKLYLSPFEHCGHMDEVLYKL